MSASEDHGVGWAWIHWMVCISLPSFQGMSSKLFSDNTYEVVYIFWVSDFINAYEISSMKWFVISS